jgi:hypothetical protein
MLMERDEKETVEVTWVELEQLRLAKRRLDWYLRFMGTVFCEAVSTVVKRVDEHLDRGDSPEGIGAAIRDASIRTGGAKRAPRRGSHYVGTRK